VYREKLLGEKKKYGDRIAWRGHEITRVEALSDAVFAFAATLLIMSLEVPHNYQEFMKGMYSVIPFGICFLIMFVVWYQQNRFFRRFGLHDVITVSLNGVLMFCVLVYMFPLKFLISSGFSTEFHFDNSRQAMNVYCLYSGGFFVFNMLFSLMYMNAHAKRTSLNLTKAEDFSTMTGSYAHLAVAVVSLISVSAAFFNFSDDHNINMAFASGSYALIGPVMGIMTSRREKIYKRLVAEENAALVPEAEKEEMKAINTVKDDSLN
jgi:uncharacterized membrane protein